jgi:2'-5' RNA ligase
VRLFVAAAPPVAVLAHLDEALPRALPGGPRWVEPARWHLTLAFLGDVPERRLGALTAALGAAAAELPPAPSRQESFADRPAGGSAAGEPADALVDGEMAGSYGLRLAGAGTFGARGRPGVLWVGIESTVDGSAERLGAAAGAVARAARGAGVAVERRPFRAHLTVGRWRPGDAVDQGVVEALRAYRGPAFELAGYVLVRSVLGPSPTYKTLASWPVGG